MKGVEQCSENYIPLSPISFLKRAAALFGDKISIIYHNVRFSWKQTHQRCLNLASALVKLGISPLDVVAALAPNVPALYELHFGVPMAGAVLSALNPKLDPTTLAVILEQLEAKIILVDHQYVDVVVKALDKLSLLGKCKLPTLVIIPEEEFDYETPTSINVENIATGGLNYSQLLAMGKMGDKFEIKRPNNECDPISVNYTSGTTGVPKGAVYSHRAVYLNSLAVIFNIKMNQKPVFIWTVDMFRCNGWCYPWAIAALGGTNVCLRTLSAKIIFELISLHRATHLCGKPIILNMIAEYGLDIDRIVPLQSRVEIIVAGTLPDPNVLMKVTEMGFNISHGYGMTEVLGPATLMPWKPDEDHQFSTNCNGIPNLTVEGVDVKDSNTMESVPFDGKTMGEIMFRSNTMMLGYLKNSKATQEAFRGGWYRTGDVGIRHPNGYIQIKDRARDVIISGGDAISTLEVEAVVLTNPKVLEAAVVGKNDEFLGKSVCAFVKLKEGCFASSSEIIKFCEENLPAFMVPHDVIFGDLPVNSTGKVQKYVLREKVNVRENKHGADKDCPKQIC